MASPSPRRDTYHPEIQGVRTLGALLVALFHIWFAKVSGGVDVFFVISGFLMTRALMGRYLDGRFSIFGFWGNIIRRIAPVAYLVMFVALIGSFWLVPENRWLDTISHFKNSLIHTENWKLIANSVDYLARDTVPNPLQHYWALSVQVQFYVLWPFLILLTGYFAVKRKAPKSSFGLSVGATFVISLLYSIWATNANQTAAYFDTFARLWEFALGGLVAIYQPMLQGWLSARARAVLGWVGVAGVISCGFVLETSSTFPGYLALWPTLSAAMVVAAGNSGTGYGAERLLASRPFVILGGTSFAFYLWHWPILIFTLEITEQTTVGLWLGLAIFMSALLLALLTVRLVEAPLRESTLATKSRWRNYAFGTACAIPVTLGIALWHFDARAEYAQQRRDVRTLSAEAYPGSRVALTPANQLVGDVPIHPDSMLITDDKPMVYDNGCHQGLMSRKPVGCVFGPKENYYRTIALIGGSHVAQWAPLFKTLAERNKWRVISFTKSACALAAEEAQDDAACHEWNRRTVDKIIGLKPDFVFTMATRPRGTYRFVENHQEYVPPAYIEKWKTFLSHDIAVIALRNNPWMKHDVPSCVVNHADNPIACARSRSDVLDDRAFKRSLESLPKGVRVFDLTSKLCDDRLCYAVMGNVAIYRDSHHISVPYVNSLTDAFEAALKAKMDLRD